MTLCVISFLVIALNLTVIVCESVMSLKCTISLFSSGLKIQILYFTLPTMYFHGSNKPSTNPSRENVNVRLKAFA